MRKLARHAKRLSRGRECRGGDGKKKQQWRQDKGRERTEKMSSKGDKKIGSQGETRS